MDIPLLLIDHSRDIYERLAKLNQSDLKALALQCLFPNQIINEKTWKIFQDNGFLNAQHHLHFQVIKVVKVAIGNTSRQQLQDPNFTLILIEKSLVVSTIQKSDNYTRRNLGSPFVSSSHCCTIL